jgi:hypothetical protein
MVEIIIFPILVAINWAQLPHCSIAWPPSPSQEEDDDDGDEKVTIPSLYPQVMNDLPMQTLDTYPLVI